MCVLLLMSCSCCAQGEKKDFPSKKTDSSAPDAPSPEDDHSQGSSLGYVCISPEEAKAIMESGRDHILLDVREENEYLLGHIPGALLLPHQLVRKRANDLLPDKDALILVYCRSGRRSKIAAQTLSEMGYKNVKEFGGILDWPYEMTR